MSLGVTVIADGKSLVQTTLRLHQSIKFRNFSFSIHCSREEAYYSKQQQKKSIDRFADQDKKR